MLRHALWLGVGFAVSLARGPGCGGSDDPEGSVNSPCTRDKDCQRVLVCAQGVCSERDAGQATDAAPAVDAASGDASRDGSDGG